MYIIMIRSYRNLFKVYPLVPMELQAKSYLLHEIPQYLKYLQASPCVSYVEHVEHIFSPHSSSAHYISIQQTESTCSLNFTVPIVFSQLSTWKLFCFAFTSSFATLCQIASTFDELFDCRGCFRQIGPNGSWSFVGDFQAHSSTGGYVGTGTTYDTTYVQ